MRYTESRTIRNPSDFETFEGFSVLSEAPFGSVRGHDSDRPPAATFRTLSFLQGKINSVLCTHYLHSQLSEYTVLPVDSMSTLSFESTHQSTQSFKSTPL